MYNYQDEDTSPTYATIFNSNDPSNERFVIETKQDLKKQLIILFTLVGIFVSVVVAVLCFFGKLFPIIYMIGFISIVIILFITGVVLKKIKIKQESILRDENIFTELDEVEKQFESCSEVVKNYYGREILYTLAKDRNYSFVRITNGKVLYVMPLFTEFFLKKEGICIKTFPDYGRFNSRLYKAEIEVTSVENITKVKETSNYYKIYGTRQFSIIEKPFLNELPQTYEDRGWTLIPKKIGENSDILRSLQQQINPKNIDKGEEKISGVPKQMVPKNRKPFDWMLFLMMLAIVGLACFFRENIAGSVIILIGTLIGIIPFHKYNMRKYKDKRNIVFYSFCIFFASMGCVFSIISSMPTMNNAQLKEFTENPMEINGSTETTVTQADIDTIIETIYKENDTVVDVKLVNPVKEQKTGDFGEIYYEILFYVAERDEEYYQIYLYRKYVTDSNTNKAGDIVYYLAAQSTRRIE